MFSLFSTELVVKQEKKVHSQHFYMSDGIKKANKDDDSREIVNISGLLMKIRWWENECYKSYVEVYFILLVLNNFPHVQETFIAILFFLI